MKIVNQITPISVPELLQALCRAWSNLHLGAIDKTSIEMLAAHWALETGWGKSCHNYNLGNAKYVSSMPCDHTYFECGENLSIETARKLAQDSRVVIARVYNDGREAEVRIKPEHPGCAFCAFPTLDVGAEFYLNLLNKKFAWAFSKLRSGPSEFAMALRNGQYYTAPLATYTAGLTGCLHRVRRLAGAWEPAEDGITADEVPWLELLRDIQAEDAERDAMLKESEQEKLS